MQFLVVVAASLFDPFNLFGWIAVGFFQRMLLAFSGSVAWSIAMELFVVALTIPEARYGLAPYDGRYLLPRILAGLVVTGAIYAIRQWFRSRNEPRIDNAPKR